MFLVLAGFVYLAISLMVVAMIDFAICRRYSTHSASKRALASESSLVAIRHMAGRVRL